jgi:hypothetical protein
MAPYWILGIFTVLTQFFIFLRWLHRRLRDEEIVRVFIREMAFNHLPYIYQTLRLIAEQVDAKAPAPPPVSFLEFDDSPRGR